MGGGEAERGLERRRWGLISPSNSLGLDSHTVALAKQLPILPPSPAPGLGAGLCIALRSHSFPLPDTHRDPKGSHLRGNGHVSVCGGERWWCGG